MIEPVPLTNLGLKPVPFLRFEERDATTPPDADPFPATSWQLRTALRALAAASALGWDLDAVPGFGDPEVPANEAFWMRPPCLVLATLDPDVVLVFDWAAWAWPMLPFKE